MKKKYHSLFILFFLFSSLFAQEKKVNHNFFKKNNSEIGISIPLVFSNYEVTNLFGIFGADKNSNGNSWSTGINITYLKYVLSETYLLFGSGFFKQNFDFTQDHTPTDGGFRTSNARPFLYNSSNSLLYSTNFYCYYNYQFSLGLGQKIQLSKNLNMKGNLTYSQQYTFKQKYYVAEFQGYEPQVNRNNYLFSKSLILSLDCNKNISDKFSIGVSILFPFYTKFRKDNIFV